MLALDAAVLALDAAVLALPPIIEVDGVVSSVGVLAFSI